MLGSRRMHYAFMDSRGKGLKDLITSRNKSAELMDITVWEGATLNELVEGAASYLKGHPFDIVYIAGGACDITRKDRVSKKIFFEWEGPNSLKSHLVDCVNRANTRLLTDFPAPKVVFCPLVASELKRVVSGMSVSDSDQLVVEEAIWEFNSTVFKINRDRGTVSPALHHQVHRFCKGTRRAYYHHLQDGLHPSTLLKEKWANEFIKVMAHN